MPWTAKDAYRHTKKASTPNLQRQWAHIANGVLESGGDEAKAIREANAVVARGAVKSPRRNKKEAENVHS